MKFMQICLTALLASAITCVAAASVENRAALRHATQSSRVHHHQQQQRQMIKQGLGVDPDFNRDVPELVTSKNYPCEVHSVTTEDGFVLGVHRIPAGVGAASGVINPTPVILMHGLLDSSATWVMNTAEESLGFILADAGYDVWMGNSRGNYYSRQHVKYSPDQKEFWEFSFDEMGAYDVPALVDYVLEITNQTTIAYVGHSQGTTQMFVALSSNPKLNSQINLFTAMAPVTFVHNQESLLFGALAEFHVDEIFELFGINEFLPSSTFIHDAGAAFCTPYPDLCEDLIFLLCGPDPEPNHNLNATRFPVYLGHTPAGTSVQNMAHWATHVRQNVFNHFDYGNATANMEHYNQTTPPAYDLAKITAPIAMFTGSNDALADPTDFDYMMTLLSPNVVIHHDNQPMYDHIDFSWGIDDHVRIYPSITSLLKQYAQGKPSTVKDSNTNIKQLPADSDIHVAIM